MTALLALLVDHDGAYLVHVPDDTLEPHCSLIGGYVTRIMPTDVIGSLPSWAAYLDEDGEPRGLAPNVAATRIARAAGWEVDYMLRGPVLFLGDAGYRDRDVPAPLVTLARGYLATGRDPFVCPRCGIVSWHPADLRHRYCGSCHEYFPQSTSDKINRD